MAKQTSKPADSMVTIEFTKNAQLRGRGYFRGNRIQVDAATADAYCRVEQAVLVSELDEAHAAAAAEQRDRTPPTKQRDRTPPTKQRDRTPPTKVQRHATATK